MEPEPEPEAFHADTEIRCPNLPLEQWQAILGQQLDSQWELVTNAETGAIEGARLKGTRSSGAAVWECVKHARHRSVTLFNIKVSQSVTVTQRSIPGNSMQSGTAIDRIHL